MSRTYGSVGDVHRPPALHQSKALQSKDEPLFPSRRPNDRLRCHTGANPSALTNAGAQPFPLIAFVFVFAQGFAVLLPTDQTESRTALCVGLSIRYRPHYPSAPAARPLTGGNTSSPKVSFAYASISCESVSSSTYRPQMLMVH